MKMSEQDKSTIKKLAGFTLIEVLVSVFVFLIVMAAVIGVFVQQTSNFTFIRVQQRNVENAQFALNFMSKTLRTSSVRGRADLGTLSEGAVTDRIFVYDFSQAECFRFRFDNAAGTLEVTSRPPDPGDDFSCGRSSHYNSSTTALPRSGPYLLTTGYVQGNFKYYGTERDVDDDPSNGNQFRIGLISMNVSVSDQSGSTSESVVIQSSVSLRDYPAEFKF